MSEIGIDIGGTFTDVVCRDPAGRIRLLKLPTTRDDPSRAVLAALAHAATEWGVAPGTITRFAHGTTVSTNAVLERRGARTALITTQGFRDVLEIGRQIRRQMYDLVLRPETPVFLAPRERRFEVPERVDAEGRVVTPLDEPAVRALVGRLGDAQAVAVCFLFSFLNPAHEQRVREIVGEMRPDLPVSLSCEVDPAFREYERTCVTAFDAYAKPVVATYLANLEAGLAQAGVSAPLQVMQSRGGLMSSAIARRRPVRLFLSGPAAGVVGGVDVGRAAGHENLITVDIGGTSCDIALVTGGRPLIRAEGVIDGFPVRVPMIDATPVGAGGGSIAWLDGAGTLRVGPHSAGSEPGPACYGRGGTEPTVTDASVVLGYIDPEKFAGGALSLRPDLAHAAIARVVAGPLGMDVEQAALGIHRVLNAQMAEAIRLVSIGRGIDPRGYALLPLGGGGPMHATALAEELAITAIVVPPHPGVLAAAGLLGAPVEHEMSAAFPRPLAGLQAEDLSAPFAALDAQCAALMRQEGIHESEIGHFADLCYIGQAYHLEVPVALGAADAPARMYRDFQAAHDRVYGHSTDGPAKIVNLRSVHRGGAGRVAGGSIGEDAQAGAAVGQRDIRIRHALARVAAAILQRAALGAGDVVRGPAVIEQIDTTILVEPGWAVRPAGGGALLMTRD